MNRVSWAVHALGLILPISCHVDIDFQFLDTVEQIHNF